MLGSLVIHKSSSRCLDKILRVVWNYHISGNRTCGPAARMPKSQTQASNWLASSGKRLTRASLMCNGQTAPGAIGTEFHPSENSRIVCVYSPRSKARQLWHLHGSIHRASTRSPNRRCARCGTLDLSSTRLQSKHFAHTETPNRGRGGEGGKDRARERKPEKDKETERKREREKEREKPATSHSFKSL